VARINSLDSSAVDAAGNELRAGARVLYFPSATSGSAATSSLWTEAPVSAPSSTLLALGADAPDGGASVLSACVPAFLAAANALDTAGVREGETLVVTGINSTLGAIAAQLAAARGVRTIGILRERVDYDEQVARATKLGVSSVIGATAADSAAGRETLAAASVKGVVDLAPGSPASLAAVRSLQEGGTHVVVHATESTPFMVPASRLIERGLTVRGFSLESWLRSAPAPVIQQALKEAVTSVHAEKVKVFVERHAFAQLDEALERVSQGGTSRQIVVATAHAAQ
jgi:D-arabinose 1-dehydrogenase-like Zn-dependent alcohol dehydrogenase